MTDFTPPTAPPTFDASDPASVATASASSAARIGPESSPGGSGGSGSGGSRSGGSKVWIFALVAIAAAAAAAYFTRSDDQIAAATQMESSAEASSTASDSTASDSTASDSPAAPQAESGELANQTADVVIEGTVLDQMPNTGGPTTPDIDPAIGQIAPTLTGVDFEGNEVTIGPDGRPKAVYFLAHWCPHCQVEVPTIQGLIDAGRKPENLDIYGVSSAVALDRGNYPPQAWFETERWSSPVMVDSDDSSALVNYGAGGFPFVVFLDGENRVLTRAAGEMPAQLMQQVWDAVAATS